MAKQGRKGAYSEWVSGNGLKTVCKWVKLGVSIKQVAHNIGVHEGTIYEWMKRFPEFAKAIKEAKQVPDLEVENAMFDAAVGRTTITKTRTILDVKTGMPVRIERIEEQVPPNITAQIFWMKNRQPERWRDINRTELSGTNGEAIQTESRVQFYLPDNGRDKNE